MGNSVCFHKIQSKLERVGAKLKKALFFGWELFLSRIYSKRKLKILFSTIGKKTKIETGFRLTQHEIEFGEMTLLKMKQYDLVVPLIMSDLKYLNSARHLIANNLIPIPSSNIVDLCVDKPLLNQVLIRKGFGEFIPEMGNIYKYPYILKKRDDTGGENSHIIYNPQQEQDFADILASPDYFCQEVIPGSYVDTAHILYMDHRIVRLINVRHIFSTDLPIQGKDEELYSRICRCPYSDLFTSILASISFDGLCCIDYKVHHDRLYILEINPRICGSLLPYFFCYLRYLC